MLESYRKERVWPFSKNTFKTFGISGTEDFCQTTRESQPHIKLQDYGWVAVLCGGMRWVPFRFVSFVLPPVSLRFDGGDHMET